MTRVFWIGQRRKGGTFAMVGCGWTGHVVSVWGVVCIRGRGHSRRLAAALPYLVSWGSL